MGIKSINGSVKVFTLTENINFEIIKAVFIKGYQNKIYLPLFTVDTKENGFVILQWKINELSEYQYPYLVFLQHLNN